MKREHKDIVEVVPFRESLVFYAPLTEGDLTDHVSGQSLVYPSGRVVFDSERGMYLFSKMPKTNEIYFPVNLYAAGIQQCRYTIFVDCQAQTYGYYNYPPYVVIGGYSDTTSWRPSVACIRDESNTTRGLRKKRAFVATKSATMAPEYSAYYIDDAGVHYVFGENNLSLGSVIDPQNWTPIMKQRVSLNPKRDSNDTNYKVYLKDIRIYNRALSENELAQL